MANKRPGRYTKDNREPGAKEGDVVLYGKTPSRGGKGKVLGFWRQQKDIPVIKDSELVTWSGKDKKKMRKKKKGLFRSEHD